MYKIRSKTISNRLTNALLELIFFNECAFLRGRFATDNEMIGLELINQIFQSKSYYIVLKLSQSKVFNRIKWNLMAYILRHEFLDDFVQLIYRCISFSQIGIRFNKNITQYFKPSRVFTNVIPYLYISFLIHNLHGESLFWREPQRTDEPIW